MNCYLHSFLLTHKSNTRLILFVVFFYLFSIMTAKGQEVISDSILLHQQNEAAQTLMNSGKKRLLKLAIKKEKMQNRMLKSIQKIEAKGNSYFDRENIQSNQLDFYSNNKDIKNYKYFDSLELLNSFLEKGKIRENKLIKNKTIPISVQSDELKSIKDKMIDQNKIEGYLKEYGKSLANNNENLSKWVKKYNKRLQIEEEKLKYWENYYKEPDKLEEKALEYLKGVEGFEQVFKNDPLKGFEGVNSQDGIEELKRLGYQTKEQLNDKMKTSFGEDVKHITKNMSESLQKYQEQINKITEEKKNIQSAYQNAKNDITSLNKTPAFKNPMRGIPFWHRWKPGFNFETYRSTENKPAFLKTNATISFQQTNDFQFGLGAFFHLGLGKDLRNIHFSNEGFGLSGFCSYNILFGFSLEGGYERSWQTLQLNENLENNSSDFKSIFNYSNHNTYLGLKKSYSLSKKWQTEFLIGYNFMWKENYLKTPFLVRMGWKKK